MDTPKKYQYRKIIGALATCILFFIPRVDAAILTTNDPDAGNSLGEAVSSEDSIALVGDYGNDIAGTDAGSAYIYKNLDNASGTITQNARLTTTDAAPDDNLGISVSLSGSNGLVGAHYKDTAGSAYLYRGLDTATGTVMQDAKLNASDRATDDNFGTSLSLSGSIGLVGASGDSDAGSSSGSAYLFRDLDTATGTVNENAKLTASDADAGDDFGGSVSLSGSIGLIGAASNTDAGTNTGSAYVFRNLDTATGNVTENAKLTASNASEGDNFGSSLSLSGSIGLVGANAANNAAGSAYLFRDLDTATGDITENTILTASDAAENDIFGISVSLSGSVGLVGAAGDDTGNGNGYGSGSVYLYRNLDTATGNVTEDIKITASDTAQFDFFGFTVNVSGNNFTIGTSGKKKAYSGTVSSITTVDAGDTTEVISGYSFESNHDWIVGENSDRNQLTLSSGDKADITEAGKSVFIGKNAGSDNNTLIIEGNLVSNDIYVGSVDGNTDNVLQIEAGATFDLSDIFLAWDNRIVIEGDYSDSATLFALFDDTNLKVETEAGGTYELATVANDGTLWRSVFKDGYTTIFTGTVPEPTTYALITGLIVLAWVASAKRRKP